MTLHRYHVFGTAAGFCAIAWSDIGISRFQLPTKSADDAENLILRRLPQSMPGNPRAEIDEVLEAVRQHFSGAPIGFSGLALDIDDKDPFFRDVYSALRKVGWGETTTYGALAKELGAGPEAARKVGRAMANNPVPLIIPCHRVLAAGGKLGGFSAPGGPDTKMHMLELEGARPARKDPAQHAFAF